MLTGKRDTFKAHSCRQMQGAGETRNQANGFAWAAIRFMDDDRNPAQPAGDGRSYAHKATEANEHVRAKATE
jgi:hypothetical protein